MPFDTIDINPDGNGLEYVELDAGFLVSVPGVYMVQWFVSAALPPNSAASSIILGVEKNLTGTPVAMSGVPFPEPKNVNEPTSTKMISGAAVVKCVANDRLYLVNESSDNMRVMLANGGGYQVGATLIVTRIR